MYTLLWGNIHPKPGVHTHYFRIPIGIDDELCPLRPRIGAQGQHEPPSSLFVCPAFNHLTSPAIS